MWVSEGEFGRVFLIVHYGESAFFFCLRLMLTTRRFYYTDQQKDFLWFMKGTLFELFQLCWNESDL